MTCFSWAMNLNNALGRYVYLQHCNVSWHPANTWKESNFRREEVTSPIIIFKAPVSLILWSYQRFICYHKAKKNWGVGFLQGMPAHISLNVTLKHRPISFDSLLHWFCVKNLILCFLNYFPKFQMIFLFRIVEPRPPFYIH